MSRLLSLIMSDDKDIQKLPTDSDSVRERKRIFLDSYSEVGTVSEAALTVGMKRHSVFMWVKRDDQFAKEFEESKKAFAEKLEGIALDLVNQMKENKDYKHPTLLITLLNANNPAKYRGTAEVDNTARDFIAGLRRVSKESRELPEQNNDNVGIIPYQGAKEAIQKKFGSLKNGNADSD